MIQEHCDVMDEVSNILSDIFSKYERRINFTVRYLDDYFHAIEVFIIDTELTDLEYKKFIKKLDKNESVTEIYTLEERRLFVIYLKSLKTIRELKINKLQNKMSYGI